MNYHKAQVYWVKMKAVAKLQLVRQIWLNYPCIQLEEISRAAGVPVQYAALVVGEEKALARVKQREEIRFVAEQIAERAEAQAAASSGAKVVESESGARPFTLEIPRAFIKKSATREEILDQLEKMAGTVASNVEAIGSLYMRICDVIRESNIPHKDARAVLSKHLNKQRTSEILCVSRAPREVYLRYRTGLFGFNAALKETRSNQPGTSGPDGKREGRQRPTTS